MSGLPWLEELWQSLTAALANERLAHALLIQGPAGLGKQALARRLMDRLLCNTPDGNDACGQCRSCQLLAASDPPPPADGEFNVSTSHPDFVKVAPESPSIQIKVDEVREIIQRLALTPSISMRRAAYFGRADQMNRAAANALLKTLEEPPAGAWLILASDHPARLPATIRSRCMMVTVRPPVEEIALKWLAAKTSADGDTQRLALKLSGGAPLTALDWLEQDRLEFANEVLDAMSGAGNPVKLGDQWQKQAPEAWRWLARWCAAALKSRLAPGEAQPDLARLAALPAALLQAQYDRACQGLRLSATPVRQDLLLADWLIQWRKIVRVN